MISRRRRPLSRTRLARLAPLAALPLLLAAAPPATRLATWSFSASGQPGTAEAALSARDGEIRVDLSRLPEGAEVWRALLRVRREHSGAEGQFPGVREPVRIVWSAPEGADGGDGEERPLALRPPRHLDLDATEAVRAALRATAGSGGREGRQLTLRVDSFPGWSPRATRLDVSFRGQDGSGQDGSGRRRGGRGAPIASVSGVSARHRAGQTFITWREPEPWLRDEGATMADLGRARERADREVEVRYRIYRLDRPIDARSLPDAELLDEVDGFTAWNGDHHGRHFRPEQPALRHAVVDGGPPVAPGTGIYVHAPAAPGRAWYAVSLARAGEEDLSRLLEAGGAVAGPVLETVGPGEPVLQSIETPESFVYVDHPTIHHYVRWEAPPRANLPSRPFDYLVGIPASPRDPAPLCIALHCWGGSLRGGYGWWYGARDGAMLVATNQIPYDWWAAYHECLGTLRPWSEGVARSYSPRRIWAFVDWMRGRWRIDAARTFVGGSSMGGSGVTHWLRYGDRLAYGISWVGIHIPALSDHFRGSYEGVVGRVEWALPHESGLPVFDYLDTARYLREDPAREVPFIAYSNGKNDGAIGWRQAVEFTRALQETRRAHIFVWGQAGHGQRAYFPTPTGGGDNVRGALDIRLDESLPAFTGCSLDDAPGDGRATDGDPEGQVNRYLRWGAGEVEDRETTWSARLWLTDGAPRDRAETDVTPRRCRAFRPRPGSRVSWRLEELRPGGAVRQEGEAVVDRWGLVTARSVRVAKRPARLALRVRDAR